MQGEQSVAERDSRRAAGSIEMGPAARIGGELIYGREVSSLKGQGAHRESGPQSFPRRASRARPRL
jgi:hypothetical protein